MESLPTTLAFRDARAEEVPLIVGLLADDSLGRSREAFGDALDPAI